jgi:hypothetical protein
MVNEEVENILMEIRERVRSRELAPSGRVEAPMENGSGESLLASRESVDLSGTKARIESYLATTARAWDRLPPVMSNRSGAIARCELWMKRLIKRATRWFTWEQVNFNAATHHALLDTLAALMNAVEALNHYQQSSANLATEIKSEIQREMETQNQALNEIRVQLEGLRQARVQMEIQLGSKVESVASQLGALASQVASQPTEMDARLLTLTEELTVRVERLYQELHDEQRVCFKQLSLEATESAVLEDRARRKSDKLIEELSRRIHELEKR